MKALVIHGPNLNLLGSREPHIYGTLTLDSLNEQIRSWALARHLQVTFFQSNHEGALIDRLHEGAGTSDFIVLNPGAFTHYSYAIRDAVASIGIPVIEVHLSNIHSREEFRARSVIAPVCRAQISGAGSMSYMLGMMAGMHFAGGALHDGTEKEK
ncbi:MAG: type II 3-dehydroquinate dehydratase [Candidatus Eremiobacteraeota bacterium]|nr:type II 3-dehydroquinate dehydratase [Candidatus Eremiobacteraeota bacterium]